MSYLSVPRISFKGTAYCNPSTANNNDFANIFDIDTLQFTPTMTVADQNGDPAVVVSPPGEQTFSYQGVQSASNCRQWLMGLLDNIRDGGPYGQQAHWNYYGDHATRIDDTTVTSIVRSDGSTSPETDPLYKATISLIGTPSPMQFQDPVIVDNDPYALITSQIFSYGIKVTGADGTSLISANPASRAFAYHINVQKNLDPGAIGFQMVSAIFLLSIPKGPGVVINADGSPALADLAAAVDQGAGLQLRFIFYNAIYQIEPKQLYENFQAKNYTPNPYIGLALGTIGVLAAGDMLSAPPGRKLIRQTPIPYTLAGPQCATSSDPAKNAGSVSLGITLAEVDLASKVAFLDCVSTFPECSVASQNKYPFNQMNLCLVPSAGSPIPLGVIPNDKATYQTNAGIVAIPLAENPQFEAIAFSLATGSLAVYSSDSEGRLQPVLVESSGLDIETDDRAIYFDVKTVANWSDPEEDPVAGTATVTIKAFRKGLPVLDAVNVNLEYWMCDKGVVDPSKPQVPVKSPYFTVFGTVAQAPTQYVNAPGNKGTISVLTDQVRIPANSNGQLTLTLTGVRSGTSIMRFVDPAIPPVPPNFCWDNVDYCCIRILPFDDYRPYTNAQINNWAFIYANFFNYFALLYPVMSRVIPWGPLDAPDNPDIVLQFATQMRSFTDPAKWNSTIYMPITRELSAGKRALLWRWCALQGV